MPLADFHDQLLADPSALLSKLREYQGARHWDGGPTWEDWLVYTAAIQTHPSDGYRLLDVEPHDDEVATTAIINGWSRAVLDDEAAAEILDAFSTLDLTHLTRDLARMLSDGGQ